jgi:hypothetical protein
VPDVAGAEASSPVYRIFVNGPSISKDGMSAVAPLWTGLIATRGRRTRTAAGIRQPIPLSTGVLPRATIAWVSMERLHES